MRRWTQTWAALTFAAAGLLAVPATAQTQTTTPSPATTQATPAAPGQDHGDAAAQLQRADTALSSISSSSITGDTKSDVAKLKQHITKLQSMSTSSASGTAGAATKSATAWSKEMAAADKILNRLLTDTPTTGAAPATPSATEPQPTGTSGTVNKAETAVPLDAETRKNLIEVRSALTAYAAAMSGAAATGASAPAAADARTTADATAPASAASAAAAPTATAAAQPSTETPASTPPAASPTTPSPDPAAQPPAGAQPPATTAPSAQPPAAATPPAQADADTAAAKQALMAARDSLADLTKLPAASQLTGQPREQVTQLISNFNDLISATSNWRASYDKVDATLNSLLGSQTADESTTAAAGTAGAVGTAGSTTGSLDPAIKSKLLEFQTHLKEFERSAGGGAAPTTPAATSAPAATAASTPTSPGATPEASAAATAAPTAAVNPEIKSHVDAIDAILSSATGSLDASQVQQLKSHVSELKRLSQSK